jgi:hypothetical protein
MAKLSILENKLTDVQLKNLRLYPLVFFDGVTEASVEYDLDVGKSSVDYEIYKDDKNEMDIKYKLSRPIAKNWVRYRLVLNGENSHMDKRFAAIEKAVRDIFWNNVRVEVHINDKKVYESKNV